MRPLIGITQCLDDRGRWRRGRTYGYLDAAYADAVEQAGGLPLLLPIQAEPAQLVERLDGLLLPGGDDFGPPTPDAYPEDVHFDLAPEPQVEFDLGVLAAAQARALPVLGICYGMQLLALRRGGKVHYHVPADLPEAGDHDLPEPDGRHPLDVVPGTRLARILGRGAQEVNSLHHQAVRTPGEGLRVAASAPDGVVEAIESIDPAGPFELGVQWHPEKLGGAAGRAVFEAFVIACAGAARKG